MSAVFGLVGSVTPAELDEMGQRLAHRGSHATWRRVAEGVYLGQVSGVSCTPNARSNLSMVIDAPESLVSGSYDRILDVFSRSARAADLDHALRMPFTLAAWDDSTQTLLLARDFLGLKPLHYCRLPNGGVAFATEYKALLAIREVPARADLDAIRCLQMYKAMPAGKTLLADIYPVPPGCVLHIGRDGRVRASDTMPEVRLAVEPMSEAQACEKLRHKLSDATTPLVAGRSRIGIALSGGIDSMSVAYLARQCAPSADLVAFTAGEGPDDPEVQRAATVMSLLKGHHEAIIVPNDELVANLPLAVWHMENPIGRSETFQFFALAKLARQRGFDSLLSGMGADLLFAGMPRHKVLWMAEAMPFLRQDLLAFFEATQTGDNSRRPLARLMTALYYRGGLPAAPTVLNCERMYEPEVIAEPGSEFLNRCLMLDGQEPTSRTLARIERTLQSEGLEYSSPYLDKSVIEFAFTIPSHLKIHRGTQKYILRKAMAPLMHRELTQAPKELMRMGQGGQFAATLQQLAHRYLNRDRVKQRGFFDFEDVERIRKAARSARHPETSMRLWTLIVTEIWAETYLDARGRRPQPAQTPAPRVATSPVPIWTSAAVDSQGPAVVARSAPRPYPQPVRVLITGSTGFIGSKLAHHAHRAGLQVTAVGRTNNDVERSRCEELQRSGIRYVEADVADINTLKSALQGQDVVIHLAAAQHEAHTNSAYFFRINLEGTETLLKLAAQARIHRFVYGSTIGVYASCEVPLNETSPVEPGNAYEHSKAAAERAVLKYKDQLDVVIARISETYGPGDMRLLKLFRGIRSRRYRTLGNGANSRQPIYIDDLCRGLLLSARSPSAAGKTLIFAGPERLTTDTLVEAIGRAVGCAPARLHLPLWPFLLAAKASETIFRALGVRPPLHERQLDFFRKNRLYSTETARKLGFECEIGVAEGARRTAEWYAKSGLLDIPVKTTTPSVPATQTLPGGDVPLSVAMSNGPGPGWATALLEYTNDAVIIWEMQGFGILYWNQAAERLYGYSRDEAHGRVTHTLLKTQVTGGVQALEQTLARFSLWVGELRHTTQSGQRVDVEGRLSLLRQENGRWLVLEVNRDISDRKAAETERQSAEHQLRELRSMIDDEVV